ncbi:zeta toxin family protein [Rhizobium ruizarguesonis]
MPYLTILAGPNGSGKSSIYEAMKADLPGEFVNADLVEAALPPGLSKGLREMRAGRAVVARIRELLKERQDFVFETTLSSNHAINLIHEAKEQGYRVGLIYVVLDHPRRNIDRVRFRAQTGGHDIPDRDILRRYEISLARLRTALTLANEAVIIDNSRKVPRRLFEIANRNIISQNIGRSDLHLKLAYIVSQSIRKGL